MSFGPIRHIVIVGADTLGWTAATGLARGLQGQANIVLLDVAAKNEPACYYASQHIFDFHHNLGVNQAHLFNSGACQLQSALSLDKWFAEDRVFIGANGFLPVLHKMELHQLSKYLGKYHINDYSYATQAALKYKKVTLDSSTDSLHASCQLNCLVNSRAYAQFMRGAAEKSGVRYLPSQIRKIELSDDTGFVNSIVCENGVRLPVDLVIDNSGPERHVTGVWSDCRSTQNNSDNTVFDTLLECQIHSTQPASPITRLVADELGIMRHTQHDKLQIWQLYCHVGQSDIPPIIAQFIQRAGQNPAETPVSSVALNQSGELPFFYKNCVSIGDAAGSIPCPIISPLILAQRAISRLLDLFPGKECSSSTAAEFNRLTGKDFSEARDYARFIQFSASAYKPSESHQASSYSWIPDAGSLSPTLQQKMALFQAYGRYEDQLNQIYSRQDWLEWLGLFYQHEDNLDPLVLMLEKSQVKQFLADLKQDVARQTDALAPYR